MKELEDLKKKIQEIEKEKEEMLEREKLSAKNQNLISRSLLDCAQQITVISTAIHTCLDRIDAIDAEFMVLKEAIGLKNQDYNFFNNGTTYN